MATQELRIVVLLRECRDPQPPALVTNGGSAINERGVRWMLNPSDLAALEKALQLKESHGGQVTVLAIGPERVEDYLRTGIAMGGDNAVRISDRYLLGYDDTAMSRVLSRAFDIVSPSLILTGNHLEDRGFDAVPPLSAARSNIACVQNVLSVELQDNGIQTLKKTDRGGRQLVNTPFPAAVCFAGVETVRYPDIDGLLQSLTCTIEEWGLPELGLSHMKVGESEAATTLEEFGSPRPDPIRVVTPDPSLPAFDRILSLLSGGVTPRQVEMHFLSAEQTAEALLAIFSEEGLIPEEL